MCGHSAVCCICCATASTRSRIRPNCVSSTPTIPSRTTAGTLASVKRSAVACRSTRTSASIRQPCWNGWRRLLKRKDGH
uniref:Putative secreted peptide n=1 Tax=Anopheles braziliensis TaxID=58242 RepID=A0A2M3ZVL2_9DIPT